MPPKARAPHPYQRPGRANYYAYINWKDKDRSLDTTDEIQAIANLAKLLASLGLPGDQPAPASAVSLAELFKAADDESEAAREEKTAYEDRLNRRRVARWLAGRGIEDPKLITHQVLVDYIKSRKAPKSEENADGIVDLAKARAVKAVSNARVNRELTSWKKAMARGVGLGAVPESLLGSFDELRLTEQDRQTDAQTRPVLNRDELTAFVKLVRDARYRDYFTTMRGTGMRLAEMTHYEAADVIDNGDGSFYMRVNPKLASWCHCHPRGWTVKGHAVRLVPISADTAAAALRLLEHRKQIVTMPREERRAAIWKLGERLTALRAASGKTLDAVAKAIGCSIPNVQAYERGRKTPPSERATRLEKFYGLPVGALPRLSIGDVTFSLDPKRIEAVIKRTLSEAKIGKKVTPHDFRRAWATHMLDTGLTRKQAGQKGWGMKEVSKWLGHKDVATTERYLRVSDIPAPASDVLPF